MQETFSTITSEGRPSFEDSGHPILTVSGKPAKLAELCRLWLDKKTECFSTSLCGILKMASSHTAARIEGRHVVDAPSVLAAVVDYSERWRAQHTEISLKTSLLEFISSQRERATSDAVSENRNNAQPQEADSGFEQAVAPPWLTDVLVKACAITYLLERRKANTGVSEFLVACLATRSFQFALFSPGQSLRVRQNTLSRLRGEAKGVLGRTSDPHMEVWLEILQTIKALSPPGPVAESERHYSADRPVESFSEDVIGASEEARALAEVICLRKPGPPLAIGLFGDWGSGKSTFMNLLEASIEALCSQVAGEDGPVESSGSDQHDNTDEPTPFIRSAVHIRFNAWTYNDANLWASLASEFFQQLRCGGYRGKSQADYEQLVQRVARWVTQAEGVAASKADEAICALAEVQKLSARILRHEQEQRRLDAEWAVDAAKDIVAEAVSSEGPARKALEALGYVQAGADNQAFKQNVARDIEAITGAPGQVLTFLQALKLVAANGKYKDLGWSFWFLLAAAVSLCVLALAGELSALFSLLPVVASILPLWRIARPVLEIVNDHRARKAAKARELERVLKQDRNALKQQEIQAAEAEAAYATAEAQAARFRGGRPGQVLEFFLGESKELKALESELGTVSRVRRAFEELNSIMIALWAWQKQNRGEALTGEESHLLDELLETEKMLAQEQGATASEPATEAASESFDAKSGLGFLPELDRIVIYIDDLDRCRADQVVKVLEAVQLLLAFPLFVVVVGVDPRWLVNSLRHFYRSELGSGQAVNDGDVPLSAVPKEYLEKIFQIPVTLRQLSTGDDGTFRRLVVSLTGSSGGGEGSPAPDDIVSATATDKLFDIRPLEISLPEHEESMTEKIERIAIEDGELEAITHFASLAGRSPRSVKRLVNVYRFVRSLYRGQELDGFLGRTRNSRSRPLFPGVLFWLALDSGMRTEQVQRMRAAVFSMDARKCLISDLKTPVKPASAAVAKRLPTAARENLEAFWRIVPPEEQEDYIKAFDALAERLPGRKGIDVLQKTLEETIRFSFAGMLSDKGFSRQNVD